MKALEEQYKAEKQGNKLLCYKSIPANCPDLIGIVRNVEFQN